LKRHQFTDDPAYLPHPATWLRRGQWADEPPPKPEGKDWLDSFVATGVDPNHPEFDLEATNEHGTFRVH